MYRNLLRRVGMASMAASGALMLSLMGMVGMVSGVSAHATVSNAVVASKNYSVNVFAQGNSSYLNPDSIDVADGYVFVGYQNITLPDGTDHKSSTIVEYTYGGKVVRTFSVPGHCDGMRFNRDTNLLWAASNEDANATLVTINPDNGKMTSYTFPAAAHKGGYDDVIFSHDQAFIAASNPTLNSAGVNTAPALDEISLKGGKVTLTPVLQGNASAVNTVTGKTVTLNLTDPDSLMVDNKGDVVLDSQADSEIITVRHPGTKDQKVTVLPVTTQLDDSWWIKSSGGSLLVADSKANTIYKVSLKGGFSYGTIYTEVPSDSKPLAGTLDTIDPKTGQLTSVVTGLNSPTGLTFLPQ